VWLRSRDSHIAMDRFTDLGYRFRAPLRRNGEPDTVGSTQSSAPGGSRPGAPWGWGNGTVCVTDGEAANVTIRTGMPSGVTGLRVVAWWYDQPGKRDHVDLAVRQGSTSLATDASSDVKKRVWVQNPAAGADFRLRLTGRDIRGKDPSCGTQRKRVYWA